MIGKIASKANDLISIKKESAVIRKAVDLSEVSTNKFIKALLPDENADPKEVLKGYDNLAAYIKGQISLRKASEIENSLKEKMSVGHKWKPTVSTSFDENGIKTVTEHMEMAGGDLPNVGISRILETPYQRIKKYDKSGKLISDKEILIKRTSTRNGSVSVTGLEKDHLTGDVKVIEKAKEINRSGITVDYSDWIHSFLPDELEMMNKKNILIQEKLSL